VNEISETWHQQHSRLRAAVQAVQLAARKTAI